MARNWREVRSEAVSQGLVDLQHKMSEMSELKFGFHQPDRCGPWFVVGRYPPPDHSVSLFEWHWDWNYCRTIWSRGGFLFRGYLYGFDGGIKFPYRVLARLRGKWRGAGRRAAEGSGGRTNQG